jgi:hypothetical protein
MSIIVNKTEKGFSLEIKNDRATMFIDGMTKDELVDLTKQIKEITNEPKVKQRVWNPRSNRHEYLEADL